MQIEINTFIQKNLNLKTIHLIDPNKIELEIDKYLV